MIDRSVMGQASGVVAAERENPMLQRAGSNLKPSILVSWVVLEVVGELQNKLTTIRTLAKLYIIRKAGLGNTARSLHSPHEVPSPRGRAYKMQRNPLEFQGRGRLPRYSPPG